MTALTGMAGRVAIALLLVLLAAGSVLAAAATLPGPVAVPPAEETAAPTPADPSVTPEATKAPEASKAPKPTTAPAPARVPEAEDGDDAAPSTANLERIVARLAEKGITTTTADLGALAAKVGVGGAVRALLFADAAKKTPAEIVALFDSGKGWGVIAKELGLHPGIGSVMGNGNGLDKAAEKTAQKAERAAARAAAKAQRAAERAERKAGN